MIFSSFMKECNIHKYATVVSQASFFLLVEMETSVF